MSETRTTSSTGGQKGVKMERHDLIPAGPMRELAILYGRGARKYADHQWRVGYEWSKSIAALKRHMTAFEAGEDYDICPPDGRGCSFVDHDGNPFTPEIIGETCYNHTGSHHLTAVAWHSFVLLEFKDTHPEFDDRYIPGRSAEKIDLPCKCAAELFPHTKGLGRCVHSLEELCECKGLGYIKLAAHVKGTSTCIYRKIGDHDFEPSDPEEDGAPADTCRQCNNLQEDHNA